MEIFLILINLVKILIGTFCLIGLYDILLYKNNYKIITKELNGKFNLWDKKNVT